VSHHHDDHNYTGDLKGEFKVVDRPGKYVFKGCLVLTISRAVLKEAKILSLRLLTET